MAAKKGKRRTAKKAPKLDVLDFGLNVWLAGLGAVSRARMEGPKLFDSLVEEGAAFQEQARENTQRALSQALTQMRGMADERVNSIRGKAGATWENVEKIFQSRVQKALQDLGMPTSQQIRALSRNVDELTRAVESLRKRDRRGGATRLPSRSSGASHSAAL